MNIENITSVEKLYYKTNFYAYRVLTGEQIHTVPLDEANTDYQAIQEWIADGGTVIDNGGGE
jgi:hypothetical protein